MLLKYVYTAGYDIRCMYLSYILEKIVRKNIFKPCWGRGAIRNQRYAGNEKTCGHAIPTGQTKCFYNVFVSATVLFPTLLIRCI